ncbi:bifunctional proline dehydrogenase/L-glutamate gamma-semialdehyde dehydrogenase PutA [Leeia oryzae]|uniref:bifunctional proline dehydrogenase/L-glutamate gamma-semialdehyde dehydrogenase PutA n=1 Tax=Leeia oryzae TaxID=356662 RepID=UPI0003A11079|nr:bifunctional proline dehydrogenase/L-glutamate gamma-semialdehyde dehydrogenase PutA [Leeia oryzae]
MTTTPSPVPPVTQGLADIRPRFLMDEATALRPLLEAATLAPALRTQVQSTAQQLVANVRTKKLTKLDAFLQEYGLDTQEGVILMCLAEALLRIPDSETQDALIRGLLSKGEWDKHMGSSASWLVNASTWGLMLSGKILSWTNAPSQIISRLTTKLGDVTLRQGVKTAMGILAKEFVIGETITDALKEAAELPEFRYSYDMLGEAAFTAEDAARYYKDYQDAIASLACAPQSDFFGRNSISVKLSALHPRYDYTKRDRVLSEMVPMVLRLCEQARDANILLTLDAEEADRLELSLELLDALLGAPSLKGWDGLGLAVQAYQKRAPLVIDWLAERARFHGKTIPVRLVKGAYWDAEIKRAQLAGLEGFPVYTKKTHTDVSYMACGRRMLSHGNAFYPQFATHNAHTVAYFLTLTRGDQAEFKGAAFEFQRLHGMGEMLHRAQMERFNVPVRVYAPVGSFHTLLPYLVRRLLENGANSSFVNRLGDASLPIEDVVADPVKKVEATDLSGHSKIALPIDIFGDDRPNSKGLNMADLDVLNKLQSELKTHYARQWQAAPIIGGERQGGDAAQAFNPANLSEVIGLVVSADEAQVEKALQVADEAAEAWCQTPVEVRAAALYRGANLLEEHQSELIALLVREGGKTLNDALGEVREAIDYCRFYANEARRLMGQPIQLPAVTGEDNQLILSGRGVFFCVSPWNFPLAIFLGQLTAAIAAGNAVVAKPAGQTPLVAYRAVELLLEGGIPGGVLNFVPGSGSKIGRQVISDPRLDGVVFTGSTEVAQQLFRGLANRDGAILPLVAETGGMNAMIVDSSALPEQVVADVIMSAFNAAGQRCSALRLLFVQDDVADGTIKLLKGAMAELRLGNPQLIESDIGPVIDVNSKLELDRYVANLRQTAKEIATAPLPADASRGNFVAPVAFEITLDQLPEREVFGPVLHVIRWKAGDLQNVLAAIHKTGYGLTLGIHSRIDAHIDWIKKNARIGNIYVNRNQIGAVVGTQPFGGEGLSGTGFKAGGPHYLLRFSVERAISVNTTAAGGNASLLAMGGEG